MCWSTWIPYKSQNKMEYWDTMVYTMFLVPMMQLIHFHSKQVLVQLQILIYDGQPEQCGLLITLLQHQQGYTHILYLQSL